MHHKTKNALIIFVKNPIKGKVKTRLAKTIGDDKALEVYQLLLKQTRKITGELECDKFVFYDRFVPKRDIWDVPGYCKYVQQGDDLGERMEQAFETIFGLGYKKVVIIGSDCYELEPADIKIAFELLSERTTSEKGTSVVIGPANDGGYYLLGLLQILSEIFGGIQWSAPEVLKDTLHKLGELNKSYALLPELTDIDTASDLPDEIIKKVGLLNTSLPNLCF
ncbi:MAG: glycosyltransferase [Chitinophagaceae bacterium]|nr:MAG: glycosyltransferase [Chitinophagaceae bacterium]